MLSIVGKLYGSVLIKELGMELNVQQGKRGVVLGRAQGCMSQVFTVRQV